MSAVLWRDSTTEKKAMTSEAEKIDPMTDGREAYMNGEPMSACPYPEDSQERVEWEGAWMEAEEEDMD